MSTSQHIDNFITNGTEVLRLSEIHRQITGAGPGRRHNVAILHKSSVVLLVATWEAFVEDLAEAGLRAMVEHCKEPDRLPQTLRERVGAKYRGIDAWKLAGTGWRNACRDHLKEVVGKTIGSLNTPKTKLVDALFDDALGLKHLSSSWHWKGMSAAAAARKLDKFITLRGAIAHRVQSPTVVRHQTVISHQSFLIELVSHSSNRVRRHVKDHCGVYPWVAY